MLICVFLCFLNHLKSFVSIFIQAWWWHGFCDFIMSDTAWSFCHVMECSWRMMELCYHIQVWLFSAISVMWTMHEEQGIELFRPFFLCVIVNDVTWPFGILSSCTTIAHIFTCYWKVILQHFLINKSYLLW